MGAMENITDNNTAVLNNQPPLLEEFGPLHESNIADIPKDQDDNNIDSYYNSGSSSDNDDSHILYIAVVVGSCVLGFLALLMLIDCIYKAQCVAPDNSGNTNN